jgi:hypothetical protein
MNTVKNAVELREGKAKTMEEVYKSNKDQKPKEVRYETAQLRVWAPEWLGLQRWGQVEVDDLVSLQAAAGWVDNPWREQ